MHLPPEYIGLAKPSGPEPGRTMLATVKSWGAPLLKAKARLTESQEVDFESEGIVSLFSRHWLFPSTGFKHNLGGRVLSELIASTVIMNWLVGRAIGALDSRSSLVQADACIAGRSGISISEALDIPPALQDHVLEPLRSLKTGVEFTSAFPYAAEVFTTGREMLSETGLARRTKRAAGVFYTPSDVAAHLVARSFRGADHSSIERAVVLDPACGSGALLIQALKMIHPVWTTASQDDELDLAAHVLVGIDKSILALQIAAYAIAMVALRSSTRLISPLLPKMANIGRNLFHLDAMQLLSETIQSENVRDRLSGHTIFLVSNPPFIRREEENPGKQLSFADQEVLQERSHFPSTNVFLDFLRLMPRLTQAHGGAASMVLPLAITYNSQKEFVSTRQFMAESGGAWIVESFDRTPDSLFGDDVKTRACIVSYYPGDEVPPILRTTSLIRWSSRNRHEMFQTLTPVLVGRGVPRLAIPKIGSERGLALFRSIESSSSHYFAEDLKAISLSVTPSGLLLRNRRTAYNWLPFEPFERKHPSENSQLDRRYRYWKPKNERDVYSLYALTQSRLAYWWWRVWGDGFHLTDKLVRSIPLGLLNFSVPSRDELNEVGHEIWAVTSKEPVRAKNGGVLTTSFRPYAASDLIQRVDNLLIQEMELPVASTEFLTEFWLQTVLAGRKDELETNQALGSINQEFGGNIG